MLKTGNPDGLRSAAERKKSEALYKTDKAISQLVKEGKKINFQTVAEVAGVSVAYLYKHDSIKQRIDQLRKQQSSIKALPPKQSTLDESKKAIVTVLKERIKNLEAEVRGLRNHIEVVEGRAFYVTELEQQLKAIESENLQLKKQLEEYRCRYSLSPDLPINNSKVTSPEKKRSKKSNKFDLIKSELNALKIKMNSTLSQLIAQAPEEIVLKAIDTLKEALQKNNVRSPSGFLVEAIKNNWVPNQSSEPKVEKNAFDEWYSLAESKGLVFASTKRDGLQYVLTSNDKWISFEEMSNEYPLEILQTLV